MEILKKATILRTPLKFPPAAKKNNNIVGESHVKSSAPDMGDEGDRLSKGPSTDYEEAGGGGGGKKSMCKILRESICPLSS